MKTYCTLSATLVALVTSGLLVVGCQDKKPDPAPVATATASAAPVDSAPTELAPVATDTADSGPDAAPKPAGPGLTTAQVRVKQCCNSLRARAKDLGTSPEGAQVKAAADSCDGLVKGLGNSGTVAPELAVLKGVLKGVAGLPAVCTGF